MSEKQLLAIILGYFLILIGVSFFTSKKSDNKTFFTANKNSPWYLIAFGMIGASLSGVTFISIPGWVNTSKWSYFQTVLGYFFGYLVIIWVLLPLYYRLNLTSIYGYLEQRFGYWSHKSGSVFFMISRLLGSALRLYLVAMVLHKFIFEGLNISFGLTVILSILLIWLYTFRGGIKTIILTDTLQTAFMLLSVVLSIYLISNELDLGFGALTTLVTESPSSQIFFFDPADPRDFYKNFFGGMFITIAMTGLDQDMMQKNLSCRSLKDARKNMIWFSVILIFVNLLFLSLGTLLYEYVEVNGIGLPEKSDQLFPQIALKHFGPFMAIIFLLGLIAAAYSSADSALTALTTSFCVDILDFEKQENPPVKTRMLVHIGFSILSGLLIIAFKALNNEAVIKDLFTIAGYTYGPLLGLFFFGIFSKRQVRDKWVPLVCLLSPIICFFLNKYSTEIFSLLFEKDYKFGFELLLVNGGITALGLLLLSLNRKVAE